MLTRRTILIGKGTLRPQCFRLEDGSSLNVWMSVTHNLARHELEKELSTAGWTYLSMANAIRTTAFGFDRTKMTRAALKRLITNVKLRKCNCLEIDEAPTHSFMRMPYVSTPAHRCHIQKGTIFSRQ